MATNKAKDDQEDSGGVEIEQTRRLKVKGISYIEATATNGDPTMAIAVDKAIEESPLEIDDIDKVVSFLASFQRRFRRNEQGNGGGATDGRGQVRDSSTDSRLKGNEDQRPSDPGGEKRAGRAK